MPFTPIPRTEPIRHDTDDMQTLHPQIVTLADGRALMAYEGRTTEDGAPVYRYYGQFLDAESQPLDVPFVLGDHVMGDTNRLDIAALDDGGFAIAWGRRANAGDHFLRSFDADGTPRTDPVPLITPGEGWVAGWVNVDALPEGGFAVTWTGQGGGSFGQETRTAIFTQRFDAEVTATSIGQQVSEMNVRSAFGNIGGVTGSPSAAVLEDGSAVIVWQSFRTLVEDSHNALFGRMVDAEGRPTGDTFRIADFADRNVSTVKGHEVLPLPDGGFAVLWNDPVGFETTTPGGDPTVIGGWAVSMQRYDATGQTVGTPRALSQPTEPYAREPSALLLPDGDIALVWDTAREGLPVARGDAASWFQRLDGDFNPLAPPVRIEAGEAIGDRAVRGTLTLDTDADGAVTLVWHSLVGVGQFSVFTQTLLPQVLGTDEDDALEAPEVGGSVHGLAGDDVLIGGPGDDFLVGGPGNDLLQGGGGVNTAVFSGRRGDYDIARGPDGALIVTDLRDDGPTDGMNRLEDIQVLGFAPRSGTALDMVAVADLEIPDLQDPTVQLTGTVGDLADAPLDGVALTFRAAEAPAQVATSAADGGFAFTLGVGASGTLEAARAWQAGDPAITALDALDVLRMAVGLTPSFGPAQAQNYIAADINSDGAVTALDALEVLRAAVGLTSAHAPQWVFFDAETDWAGLNLSAANTHAETGITLPPLAGDLDIAMTGILLGNMAEV